MTRQMVCFPVEIPAAHAFPGEVNSVSASSVGPGVRYNLRSNLTANCQPGLFVCGHSHILKVMREPGSYLHLNPGAAGHHGWHKVRTILRFTVAEGRVSQLEAIELGPRGRAKAT